MALGNKDDGYIRANESTGYPHGQLAGLFCCPLALLESTLRVCLEKGKLEERDGGIYYISNWNSYQLTNRYKRMLSPGKEAISPSGEVISPSGEAISRSGKCSILISSSLSSLSSSSLKNDLTLSPAGSVAPSEKRAAPSDPSPFDLFWAKYPRRLAKADALKVWTRLVKKEKADPALVLAAVDGYLAAIKKAGTEERFVKHPATFLNADRWRDYLPDGGAAVQAVPDSTEETNRMIKRTGGKVGVSGEKL
jgi:hypothetical protein